MNVNNHRAVNGKSMNLVGYLLLLLLTLFTGTHASAKDRVVYFHNDALGSPVAATDESGNVVWREDYAPYGRRLLKEDGDSNRLWYTGKEEESALGLQYFGARWYDPSIGRFLQVDPAGFDERNIHSFNKYAYANNNPYRYVDPDGDFAITAGILIYAAFKAWDVYDAYDAVTDPSVGKAEAAVAIAMALAGW